MYDQAFFQDITLSLIREGKLLLNAAPDFYGFEITFYGPVYFYLQAWLEPLLGTGVWQFRLLNCLCGFGLVFVLYRFARDLKVGQTWALLMVLLILMENVFGNLLHSGRMDFLAEFLMLSGAYIVGKYLRHEWKQPWLYLGALLSGLALITTPRIIFLLPVVLLPIGCHLISILSNRKNFLDTTHLPIAHGTKPTTPNSHPDSSRDKTHHSKLKTHNSPLTTQNPQLKTHNSQPTTHPSQLLASLFLLFLPITYYIFISVGFETYVSRMQHPIVLGHIGSSFSLASIFRQWYNIPLMLVFFYVLFQTYLAPLILKFVRTDSQHSNPDSYRDKTHNSQLTTHNSKLPTQNSKLKTQNSQPTTQNSFIFSTLIFLFLVDERAPYSGMLYPLVIFIIIHYFSRTNKRREIVYSFMCLCAYLRGIITGHLPSTKGSQNSLSLQLPASYFSLSSLPNNQISHPDSHRDTTHIPIAIGTKLTTQNSQLKTQNSKLTTHNSQLTTHNPKLTTQNSKLKTLLLASPFPLLALTFLLKTFSLLHTWEGRKPYQASAQIEAFESSIIFAGSEYYYDVTKAGKEFRFLAKGRSGTVNLTNDTQEYNDWRRFLSAYSTIYRPVIEKHPEKQDFNLSAAPFGAAQNAP